MSKRQVQNGWRKITVQERQDKIDEIERWLLYRNSGKWFENVAIALLQEIYELREEVCSLKSQDP
jgi:hypothetical protein